MKIEVDLKKIAESIASTVIFVLIVVIGLESYSNYSKYSSIGNDRYIAHHVLLIRKENPNITLDKMECLIKHWAESTKNHIGGISGVLKGSAKNVFSVLSIRKIEKPESIKVLDMEYPFRGSTGETNYFLEKCANGL